MKVPEGFDEFWLVFPRRVAKQAAIRMYQRALKLTTPDKILNAAVRYAADRRGQDMNFTKHPATWLNGGCWGDYDTDLTKAPPAAQPNSQVYVPFEQRDAWDDYGRACGKTYPRDKAGGWWFPSPTPPRQHQRAGEGER